MSNTTSDHQQAPRQQVSSILISVLLLLAVAGVLLFFAFRDYRSADLRLRVAKGSVAMAHAELWTATHNLGGTEANPRAGGHDLWEARSAVRTAEEHTTAADGLLADAQSAMANVRRKWTLVAILLGSLFVFIAISFGLLFFMEKHAADRRKLDAYRAAAEERQAQGTQAIKAKVTAQLDSSKANGTYPCSFVQYIAENFTDFTQGVGGSEGERRRSWLVGLAIEHSDSGCGEHLDHLYKEVLGGRSRGAGDLAAAGHLPGSQLDDVVRLQSYEALLQKIEHCLWGR